MDIITKLLIDKQDAFAIKCFLIFVGIKNSPDHLTNKYTSTYHFIDQAPSLIR